MSFDTLNFICLKYMIKISIKILTEILKKIRSVQTIRIFLEKCEMILFHRDERVLLCCDLESFFKMHSLGCIFKRRQLIY